MKSTIISTLALSMLMVGCGGGSSSSPKTSSSSSVVSSVALSSTAVSSTAVSSVATSQSSSLAAVTTGVFLDGAVVNIGYRTATQQGSTNSNGEFNYRPGESITFFIGKLELPAVLAGAIITPLEIANTTNLSDNQLTNILRLLQSLDADGNAENGIEITAAAIAAGAVLDFTLPPEEFAQSAAVKALLQAAGSPNKELISAEQARAHFQTTLEFINGPASSSSSQGEETSSSASSETLSESSSSSDATSSEAPVTSSAASSEDVVAGSSSSAASESASSEAPVTSSAASSEEVIASSSSSSSSEASGHNQMAWNVYNANHHPATNGSVTLVDGSSTQFTASGNGDYFAALNDGTANLDTSSAVASTSGASIANVVNADGVYPKNFTLVAGVTGNADNLRVLELEVAMADTGVTGSRLKAILRNDGSNKGVQLEQANNTATVNSYGLNMNTFGIYQIAVTLTDATTGSVRVYRDGQLLPNMSLSNVTMRATSAVGDNFLRFGEVSSSTAYKSNIDWMVWTNDGAFNPDDLTGELPAGLGCVYGYGSSNNTTTCVNPPASSSSSSGGANSSATSSIDYGSADIRPPKMEGFAAYAGVTGGAGGPVITVTTGTELNAALCGARTKNNPTPITILVNGTINHANTSAQGCNTQADVIEIKQTANVSIIGVGTNALFDQIGIHVRDSSNVIIQNVHVRNVKKSGSPTSNGGDAIGLETDVDRVWIDHNWLEASGGEKDGYDSLIDMKSGVTNVTVSYNKFNDSSRAGLVGFNDSDTNTNITFHHNWYKNIEQRTPLIRNALVHVYNNYWSNESMNYMIHAINSRSNAKVLVEGNYFYNVNNPLIASKDSPTPGCWQTNNENTVLPYIYYSRTVENGEAHAIPAVVDGQLQSNCEVTVPYTVELDHSTNVPAIVMANAGVGKIGNGGASSSSENSSATTSSEANSSSVSSANVSSESSSVGSVASSESSSSVSGGANLSINETFAVDKATLFSAAYQSISTDATASLYFVTGGGSGITVANNQLTISAGRFTIGNRPPRTATTASDVTVNGDFDLSRPYKISFTVVATSGTGTVQVYVDNNSTSAGNSVHGASSRVFSVAANTLSANQQVVITPSVGTTTSFIAFRTESSTSITIDNLKVEYIDGGVASSSESSVASSEQTSSAIASSIASSEAASSAESSVASSNAAESSVANNEESSSSVSSSEASSEASSSDESSVSSSEATSSVAESSVASSEESSSSVASSEVSSEAASSVESSASSSEATSSSEESSSSIASSEASSEASSSVDSSVASSEAVSSSSESSATNSSASSIASWTGMALDLAGTSGNAPMGLINSSSGNTLSISTSGGNVNSSNRRYYFAYQQITGNFVFTARLSGVTPTSGTFTTTANNAYRFGLLITENVSTADSYINSARFAEAGFYTTAATPTFRGSRGYKLDTGTGSPAFTRSDIGAIGFLGVGSYMRIARTGNSVSISYSANGVDYTVANTSAFAETNLPLPSTWYVGLFGATQQELALSFDNISITQD